MRGGVDHRAVLPEAVDSATLSTTRPVDLAENVSVDRSADRED
jgi:hypothetical protein